MQYKFTEIVTIGILVAVLMPGSDVPSVGIPNIDKIVHFCMFALLAGCFAIEYHNIHLTLPKWHIGILGPILFGGLTEIMQLYVPGRSCDIKDLWFDSLGVIITVANLVIYYRNKEKNQDKDEVNY